MSVIWTNPENIYSLRVLPPLTHFGPYGALEPFGAEADYLPLFVKTHWQAAELSESNVEKGKRGA